MAAGKWKVYQQAKKYIGDGTIDLNLTNTKMALFTSASNANILSVGTGIFGDLTNEVSPVFGYTTGGEAIANPTFNQAAGTATFDCDDQVFTAAGGSIVAHYAVIYVDATVNSVVKPLVCVCVLDTAPADVTVVDGNSLTVTINASGVFTLSGATVD